jgi:hypothetical protein
MYKYRGRGLSAFESFMHIFFARNLDHHPSSKRAIQRRQRLSEKGNACGCQFSSLREEEALQGRAIRKKRSLRSWYMGVQRAIRSRQRLSSMKQDGEQI